MALDYETDVKQHAIELLAGDLFGKGRVEAAVFKTFQHVYKKGHEEGLTMGLMQNDAKVEALERQLETLLGMQAYREFWLDTVEELNRLVERNGQLRNILEYYKEQCSGAEPSLSVFHRKVDEALKED